MDITQNLLNLIGIPSDDKTMLMIVSIILLGIGFFFLIKGADSFVNGASKLAEKMKIPQIVIGLTIVAFGTSAPEAAVSITSSLRGNAGIAVGNVLGSNIFNIMFILGFTALFAKIPLQKNTHKYEVPFVLFITIVLLGLGWRGGIISVFDAVIFLVLFALFFVYLIIISRNHQSTVDDVPALSASDTVPKLIFLLTAGLILIVIGSDMAVFGASTVAAAVGISDRVIGLTIVACGTSLPELITNISAAKKGKPDIAVGNIIGSNIFNIIFILGISGLVAPGGIDFYNNSVNFVFDAIIAIATTILFWALVFKDKVLTRAKGIVMLGLYVVYTVYIIAFQG